MVFLYNCERNLYKNHLFVQIRTLRLSRPKKLCRMPIKFEACPIIGQAIPENTIHS